MARLIPYEPDPEEVTPSGPRLVPLEEYERDGYLGSKDYKAYYDNQVEKASTMENLQAGFMRGAQESFSASLAAVIESNLPVGRLFAKDKTGDMQFWQSTPDWLGVDEETWDNMEPAARRVAISKRSAEQVDQYYGGDEKAVAYNIARFTGMLLDTSTAIPVKGATIKAKMAYGAAVGGSDIAAYEAAQTGMPSVKGVAMGAALGGGLAGAVGKISQKAAAKKQAKDLLFTFEKNFAYNRTRTDSVVLAYNKTLQEIGQSGEAVRAAVETLGVQPRNFSDKSVAAKFLRDRPEKSIMKGGFGSKLLEPISDRLYKLNPRMAGAVLEMERKSMQKMNDMVHMVDPFVRKLEKLPNKAANKLWLALSEGDSTTIQRLVSENALDKDYKLFRNAMDEMYDLSIKSGRKYKAKPDFFPRRVVDHKAILDELELPERTQLDKIIKAMEKDKDRLLTTVERNDLYNKYLSGTFDPKSVKANVGAIKKRSVKLTPKLLQKAYAKPGAAVHSYIREQLDDIYRRELFGKEVVSKVGDNITQGIGELAAKSGLHGEDLAELKHLLDLKLVSGTIAPHKNVQRFKNYTYASLIGNPLSAIVQFGDLPIAMAKIGARDVMSGIVESYKKRGLTPKEAGLLNNMLEEFASTDSSKRVLDWSMKWSGFQAVDNFTKRGVMNGGVLRAFRHAAPNNPKGLAKLRNRWSQWYGDDYPILEKALKDKKGTQKAFEKITDEVKGLPVKITDEERKAVDLVRSLAFSELADLQPTTMSQMTEYYLANPNVGRTAYMLRSFSVKYLNLLRREMIDRIVSGEVAEGVKRGGMLITAFSAGGVTTDAMKDALLGRQQEGADELIVDNILKQTGVIDRYTVNKLGSSREPIKDTITTFIPPTGAAEPFARAAYNASFGEGITERDTRDMVFQIPVLGKVLANWFMGGKQEAARQTIERSYE